MDVYEKLKESLKNEIQAHRLSGKNIRVRCNALSSAEAIGTPEHGDYPIIKGKEVMVEAVFEGAKGQAFTDAFENADNPVDDLLTMDLETNKSRSIFISGLNAVFRYLDLCDKTVHCRDEEPVLCANHLSGAIGPRRNILLVGHQPRFLEFLAPRYNTRAVDLDEDNIGSTPFGVAIEPPEMTWDALDWCDVVLATGSTIVNGTISDFLDQNKPVIFYGVTISAAARILDLTRYCHAGH